MPAARVGALRFYISSDDLLIPYAINAILFACVLIAFAVVFVHADVVVHKFARHCHTTPQGVKGYTALQIDGYILLSLFVLQFLTSAGCAWFANKGTILQMKTRQPAVPLALTSSVLSVLQIPALAILIWLAYEVDSDSCESKTFDLLNGAGVTDADPLKTLKILCWVVLGFVIVGPAINLCLLNLFPSFRATAHGCCSGLARCFGFTDALSDTEGGDYNIHDEFSGIMVRLFGPMPLVASDLVAGMLLASNYQFRQRQALLAATPSQEPSRRSSFDEVADTAAGLLTPPNLPMTDDEVTQAADAWPCSPALGMPVDSKTLCEAEYLLHFAESAYGYDTTEMYGKLARTQVTDALRTTSIPKPAAPPKPAAQADHWLEFWQRLIKDPFHPFRKTHKEEPQKAGSHRERSRRLKQWRDALLGQLGLEGSDILDMQLENQALGSVPYYVALDRIRKTIVVSIRGSYSVEDAVTDLITTAAPISTLLNRGGLWGVAASTEEGIAAPRAEAGDVEVGMTSEGSTSEGVQILIESEDAATTPRADSAWKAVINQSEEANDPGPLQFDQAVYPGCYCHRGILMSAVRLLDSIRERGVLAAAITEHPTWKVVITGHSLGAGLATLLTMALEPELHGRLRCWAFCPPGGLLSVELAVTTARYVTTVIHAKDMVSRLTWRSLERLRDEVMTAVALSKINKNELWWRSLRFKHNPESLHPDNILHTSMPSDPEIQRALDRYNRRVKRMHLELGAGASLRFWAPGQIIYLRPLQGGGPPRKTGTALEGVRRSPRVYDALWISYESLEAEGLLVSPEVVEDHPLVSVHAALCQSIVRATKAAPK